MNILARAACALLAVAMLGAAPAAYEPVPKNAQTAAVTKYVDALRAGNYDAAYALLSADERAYFGSSAAYRSVFEADGFSVKSAKLLGRRSNQLGSVYFVREHVAFVDHRRDETRELDATVPIGVLAEHGVQRIKDPGKPYRAFASASTADASGLRVTVKKVEFWPDRISVVLTFANVGDGFVTLLPYGKSVLRDDKGGVYRIEATKNWATTDKQLYEGVPLAPNAQYTGSLAFTAARLDVTNRTFTLDLAPALREGADAPFDVTVAITPRG